MPVFFARRVMKRALFLICSLMLASSGNAIAQNCTEKNHDYYVTVTNNTGYTIYYLYVSHADDKNWGQDLLGNDVLLDGNETTVYLCNYSSPTFDIKVEDEDGDTYTFYSIDVSRQDLTVNLSDLD
jgi:hypothetical protein